MDGGFVSCALVLGRPRCLRAFRCRLTVFLSALRGFFRGAGATADSGPWSWPASLSPVLVSNTRSTVTWAVAVGVVEGTGGFFSSAHTARSAVART